MRRNELRFITPIEREPIEVAWAAGLFEGEGTWGANKQHRLWYLVARVEMTDRDVVEKFHKVAGFGSIVELPVRANKTKMSWAWQGSGQRAEEFGWDMLPWLGTRRGGRFQELMREVNEQREAQP